MKTTQTLLERERTNAPFIMPSPLLLSYSLSLSKSTLSYWWPVPSCSYVKDSLPSVFRWDSSFPRPMSFPNGRWIKKIAFLPILLCQCEARRHRMDWLAVAVLFYFRKVSHSCLPVGILSPVCLHWFLSTLSSSLEISRIFQRLMFCRKNVKFVLWMWERRIDFHISYPGSCLPNVVLGNEILCWNLSPISPVYTVSWCCSSLLCVSVTLPFFSYVKRKEEIPLISPSIPLLSRKCGKASYSFRNLANQVFPRALILSFILSCVPE